MFLKRVEPSNPTYSFTCSHGEAGQLTAEDVIQESGGLGISGVFFEGFFGWDV